MGQYEIAFFAKHFKSIQRLEAFRKKFNDWDYAHEGKGVWYDFDGPIPWDMTKDENGKTKITHRDGSPIKWIFITKFKVDKEIKRRRALENDRERTN